MTQREAFEAWATSQGINITDNGFGGYDSQWTEGALAGWEAAQAQAAAPKLYRLNVEEGSQDMTDRELLELAAKACGYWDAEYNCVDRIPHLGWNPLTDDGDALRLAVKLEIELWFGNGGLNASGMSMDIEEDYGEDPAAATRRAIVRAAAEIGKEST